MVDPDKKKVVVCMTWNIMSYRPSMVLRDQVPVKIFAGKCQIDFSEI